jgi:hypothetical protein
MAQGQTLWNQLNSLLPSILPKSPDDAIGGKELLKLVREAGVKGHSDDTIRSYFSWISGDPTTSMAKVDEGRGYYLRMTKDVIEEIAADYSEDNSSIPLQRINQREEKFRSLFMLWCLQQRRQYPMHLEHVRANRQMAGINKWKFPDVVSVKWEVEYLDETHGYRLDRDLLDVRRSLGEPPFRIASTELKVELTAPSLREIFFQCVSNSRWAHSAQLVVATKISDALIAEELRRLGASYDVAVISFGLEVSHLDHFPNASELLNLPEAEVEEILSKLVIRPIASSREREALDWEHIQDLQKQHAGMKDLFSWISKCMSDYRPYKFDVWTKTMR